MARPASARESGGRLDGRPAGPIGCASPGPRRPSPRAARAVAGPRGRDPRPRREVVVGHQGGDLDDGVALGVEARSSRGPSRPAPRRCYRCRRPSRRATGRSTHYRLAVLSVPVHQLDPDLPLPAYARRGDAGADLFAREDVTLARRRRAGARAHRPGGRHPTRVRRVRPAPERAGPAPRASRASTRPGSSTPATGASCRSCWSTPTPTSDYEVHRGDRIAQLVIQQVAEADVRSRPTSRTCPPPSGVTAASATAGAERGAARGPRRRLPGDRDRGRPAPRGGGAGAGSPRGSPVPVLAVHPLRPDPPVWSSSGSTWCPSFASGPSGCRSGSTTPRGSTTPSSTSTTTSAGSEPARRRAGPASSRSWWPT